MFAHRSSARASRSHPESVFARPLASSHQLPTPATLMSARRTLCMLAALVPASLALVAPRAGVVGSQRLGVVRRSSKGFGESAPKKKKKASSGPATIRVDESEDDGASMSTMQVSGTGDKDAGDAIFEKYGIDSSGRTTKVVTEPEEPAFEPLKAVPPGVQVGLEKLLIGGMLSCLAVFIVIGGFITVDAFYAAKQEALDPGLKSLIVDTLEPKFTPTLIAGFACSILLGGLKTLQLTSDGGQRASGVHAATRRRRRPRERSDARPSQVLRKHDVLRRRLGLRPRAAGTARAPAASRGIEAAGDFREKVARVRAPSLPLFMQVCLSPHVRTATCHMATYMAIRPPGPAAAQPGLSPAAGLACYYVQPGWPLGARSIARS